MAGMVLGGSLMVALRPAAEQPAVTPGSTPKVAVAPSGPPSVACPPNHCPEPICEPAVEVLDEPAVRVDPRFETVTPDLVTSAVMDVTRALGVQGTFVVDCDGYPCVAMFEGDELPSMEDRGVIGNALIEALPDQAKVVNLTHFREKGKVAWGLFVGEGELTSAEVEGAEERLRMPEDDGSMSE